ncbi:hypothetical protein MARU1_000696 [Malassezia arunalokei]|uniref:26S proteasome complex subunit SEM1 n=1 Tax=Malassezia arunalokei TaxID=1514897 RepID=A0AAJ5YZK9_9BASI|nr:hypothetical protein MARU1_000696 [Malassezia arunalokei]
MSATKPTKPSNKESAGSQEANEKKHQVPTLGALDEDDEFEEFEADDWPDQDTIVGKHNTGDQPSGAATVSLDMSGSARSGGDHLWEDNWDDDDIEDEFSVALRAELAKTDTVQPMST